MNRFYTKRGGKGGLVYTRNVLIPTGNLVETCAQECESRKQARGVRDFLNGRNRRDDFINLDRGGK